MSETDAYTDVVELCALLQCLGFNVKSLDTTDGNVSQDGAGGTRTVVINCQASGLHVVLESGNLTCSCPSTNQENSSIWQVSGMTGGKQFSKEYGSALLGSLPKAHRERLTRELQEIVRCIKEHNESDAEKPKSVNRSTSLLEMTTPEKRNYKLAIDTPTRCKSLDTLNIKDSVDSALPMPGVLQKKESIDDTDSKKMCQRQSTYTLSSTPGSLYSRRRNKTSSPIHEPHNSLLDNLIAAEKLADKLRSHLSTTIKEYTEEAKNESSMSSLVLDVSKIPDLKGTETSKIQFASSPNLSGMGTNDDFMRKFKRTESASTSNLAINKPTPKDGKISRLRRLSPNIFKSKESTATKSEKDKLVDKNSKLNSLFKPKIVTPVRIPKSSAEPSPNLSASRKKYSHVKSTIPRFGAKKE